MIGTVELFQGNEKKFIIISTVRSKVESLQHDTVNRLGFVKEPKRMNVALTRAKYGLIVVGNPNILGLDSNWRRFIKYCIDNNACTEFEYNRT